MGDMTVTSSLTPYEEALARRRGSALVWLRDRWPGVDFTLSEAGFSARDGVREVSAGTATALDAILRGCQNSPGC